MRAMILGAVLFAVPALAAEKECAGLKEDGSVILAVKYQVGKLSECRGAVNAEAAKTLCKPGDKRVKFQFRTDTAEKPSNTSALCGAAEAAPAPTPAPSK